MTDLLIPKRSLAECRAILSSPGMPHETELALVDNRVLPVYKHIDPNLRTFWLRTSSAHPDREYIVFEQERYTFKQTVDASRDVANVLREIYGVRKGDRVAITMRNFPEYIISFWACALLGAVPTLINPWLTDKQLLSCVAKTGCSVHIVDPERADSFETLNMGDHRPNFIVARSSEGKGSWTGMKNWNTVFTGSMATSQSWQLEPECGPDDDCALMFTSGTTSMPKAVLSTHRSFLSNQISGSYCVLLDMLRRGEDFPMPDPNEPQTANLLAAPLFHVAGLTSSLMGHTSMASKNVLLRKWDLDLVVQLIMREKIETVAAVPSVIIDLLQKSTDVAQMLRMLTAGGAPLPTSVPGEVSKKFPQSFFFQAYGLTETNGIATLLGGIDQIAKPDSSGLPVPVCELLIVDPESGKVMPSGQMGEVWIRGSNLFKCYYNDQVATKQALTDDGWFRSGDAGFLDDDGCLFVRDRYKDIIIRGGENIHSTTIESALYEHPEIIEAAAVGVPDHRLGELVAAAVTVKSGSKLTEREVLDFARTKLQRMTVPVMVSVRDEPLERNAAGKVLKFKLKQALCVEWEKRNAQGNISSKL